MTDSQPTEPVVPQEEQIKDPGYSYKDLQAESMREIATAVDSEKPAVEEKPTEEKEVEVPLEEVGRNIAAETAKQILEEQRAEAKRLADEQKVKEEAVKPKEDEFKKWEDALWEKEQRKPTYREALAFVTEQGIKEIEQRQVDKQKAIDDEKAQAQKVQQDNDNLLLTHVNDELDELYRAGKMTPIKDPKNASDQGVMERNALMTQWATINEERRTKGLPQITSAVRIFDFYYTKPQAQPAGADAPIAGNRGSAMPPSSQQELNYYRDVKGKSWNFFKGKR